MLGNLETYKAVRGNSQKLKTTTAEGKIINMNDTNTLTNSVRNNMYHLRASPQYVHEINSTRSMVNDLLKRSISA